jgi:hypothetical protein
MRLSSTIHQFFNKYLPHIKALSPHTVKSYRDTFKLFLPYAANYYGIKISSLQIAHLSVEVILEFLILILIRDWELGRFKKADAFYCFEKTAPKTKKSKPAINNTNIKGAVMIAWAVL